MKESTKYHVHVKYHNEKTGFNGYLSTTDLMPRTNKILAEAFAGEDTTVKSVTIGYSDRDVMFTEVKGK